MVNPILKEYFDLKNQILDLEEKRKELELQVMEIIDYEGEKGKLRTSFGTFTTRTRSSWKYSENIDSLQKKVYEAKKIEEHDGVAEMVKQTVYVVLAKNEEAYHG